MATSPWVWVAFNLFVLALLTLDLGIFHRKAHSVSTREAAGWTGVWVTLALLFCGGIYLTAGSEPALLFLTGYLIEKSLSVDNIFVFVMLFSVFGVPATYQHRVLFWGILGALVMRGILIGAGTYLIHEFHWLIYLFGAFLVFTGIRMAVAKEHTIDVETSIVVRLVRRIMPLTRGYRQGKFFVREAGKLAATPLFLVLVIIELTDLMFAVDSIPAILAVTTDPFIVYTSNVFAILGLRSLYFLLAGMVDKFHYLKVGLSAILVFVGVKMLIADVFKIPVAVSLGVIVTLLTLAIVGSLLFPKDAVRDEEPEPERVA